MVLWRWPYRAGIIGRYLMLVAGEGLSKLCVLGVFAYLARTLSPEDFGLVELALSTTLILVMTVDGGLGSFGARIIAAWPDQLPQMLARIVLVRVVLAIVAYISILVVSANYGTPGVGVLAIFGLTVLFGPLFTQWVFQGLGQMHWVAAGTALRTIVFAACVLSFVRKGTDARLVAAAEIIGVLALVTYNLVILKKVLYVRFDWRGVLPGAIDTFKQAWPIGASQAAWGIMWYAPLLALGRVSTLEEVAWLAAPLRVVVALHTFVWLYFFNVLPRFSSALVEGVESWRLLAVRSLRFWIWIACLIAVSGTVLASTVVTTFYGAAYHASAFPFQLLIWMIPMAALNGHFRYTLVASGQQRIEFTAAAAAAALTLVIALWLGQYAGSAGSAAALLVGGVFYTVATALSVQKLVGILPLARLVLAPAATCLFCLVIWIVAVEFVGEVMGGALAFVAFASVALSRSPDLGDVALGWLRR